MREIKFRAWHYEKGNPLYKPEMRYSQTFDLSLFFQNVAAEPCSVEVMQYTGLKDKNGVEIYEGDVIRLGLNGELLHTVYYDEEIAAYDVKTNYGHCHYTLDELAADNPIIGNICKNPELLS